MKEYHRVYAAVDVDALKFNIKNIREKIGADTKLMPVIKADAYGHGAVQTARVLDSYADSYAVAVIEEACELRRNGITKPILILGYTSPSAYTDALKNDISLTVYSFTAAKKLSDAAKEAGCTGKLHIALDTGMSRIGFSCTPESVDEIERISRLENLEIEGIFTHFATADEADKSFTRHQKLEFDKMCASLSDSGVDFKMRHICNSAGIMEFSAGYYEMVRAGIILYGLYPSYEVCRSTLEIKPVLELKSHIVNIKTVPKGTGVSYGRTFTAECDTVIATIPVGYADGYPRSLSNKGRVLINGKFAPIIGRVCMDQFMVDITDIDGVSIEDEVTLIGKDGENEITADEIASLAGTINYEITCGISKRVPRILCSLG